jgi:hypothetical protein
MVSNSLVTLRVRNLMMQPFSEKTILWLLMLFVRGNGNLWVIWQSLLFSLVAVLQIVW